jgi:murein DD-endopeptidase MepM/ murein hydrolase activator NlpD
MQIMFTDSRLGRTRVVHIGRWHVLAALLLVAAVLVAPLLRGLREPAGAPAGTRWPALSTLGHPAELDDPAQRERILRENLDAMAVRLGEMQAKLVRLEAIGERVSGLAGLKPEESGALAKPGARGGPYVPLTSPSREQLDAAFAELDERVDQHLDLFTLIESRLFEDRLARLMIPNTRPVDGRVGSGFGMRSDPFTGRPALHTGLDLPADSGTPIKAAAGGVVLSARPHPAYGNLVEIDHGNGLVTRYAHASKLLVKQGDLVRRGQKVALVGSTGRSTGAHLHFEVMVEGVHQNPAKFLAGGDAAMRVLASRGGKVRR